MKYSDGMRPSDRDAMLSILSATDQMTRLTEDLLLLARADQTPTVKLAPVNLSSVLEDLSKLYCSQAAEKEIQIITDIEPNLLVRGDSIDLTRAFTNLLQNAIRYTQPGGKIELSLRFMGDWLHVAVKDTGIGIAKENLEKVFERFWQADGARKFDNEGAGLGLSITQSVVQKYGGRITVTSDVGVGSCFMVDLPIGFSTSKRQ